MSIVLYFRQHVVRELPLLTHTSDCEHSQSELGHVSNIDAMAGPVLQSVCIEVSLAASERSVKRTMVSSLCAKCLPTTKRKFRRFR